MSAAVCGSKRSFFEEIAPSSPLSKKLRCSSSSPVWLPPPSPIQHLTSTFPQIDTPLLERALEDCDNDIDAAIKTLHELCTGSAKEDVVIMGKGPVSADENVAFSENQLPLKNLPVDGAEWVELFVKEITSCTNLDDAKDRAGQLLDILEKTISAYAGAKAAECFRENAMLKEQIELQMRDNTILKRAVAIQHERHKENENVNREMQHLKQLVSQYHEQLRALEVKNYALTMHLKQAQQNNTIPGRFNPDIF